MADPTSSRNSLRNLKLKAFHRFRKRAPKSPSPPKVTRYANLSTHDIPASPGFAPPNLGEDGWGTKGWEHVRPDRDRQREMQGYEDEDEDEEDRMSIDRAPSQSGRSISTTRSSFHSAMQYPRTPPRQPSLTSTSPLRRCTPAARSPASRRAPSTISVTSSRLSQTARSVSGSSFTTTGAHVKAEVRGAKGRYTKQGVRIASDGYVGKWKDPEKEMEGVPEVWKGHPALQPKPGVGGGM